MQQSLRDSSVSDIPVDGLSNIEWLQARQFSAAAPAAVVKAAAAGKPERFTKQLVKHAFGITSGKHRKTLAANVQRAARIWQAVERWSSSEADPQDEPAEPSALTSVCRDWLGSVVSAQSGKAVSKKVVKLWQESANAACEAICSADSAAETVPDDATAISLTLLLLATADRMELQTVFTLYRAVSTWATARPTETDSADQPGEQCLEQLANVLAPWTAGVFLGIDADSEHWRTTANAAGEQILNQSVDNDGTPRPELLPILEPWCAGWLLRDCWQRMSDVETLADESSQLLHATLLRAATLLTADGHLTGSAKLDLDWPHELSVLVAEPTIGDWSGLPRLLKSHAGETSVGKRKSKTAATEDVEVPAFQSDWASLACLRPTWTRRSPLLLVQHEGEIPSITLQAHGREWLHGPWDIEVFADGEPQIPVGEWTCVCWHSDDDVDYVELQCQLGEHYKIERQILLSRKQDFLLLSDSISGGTAQTQFECQSQLPLTAAVTGENDRLTRECRLIHGKRPLRVFPLALPAERLHKGDGVCEVDVGHQRLQQQLTGTGGLIMPTVFDWKPTRKSGYAEWQRLTVAEDGNKVGCGRAAGFRIRVGNYQLLIYRSFANGPRRTVLGQHTGHECLIGEVQRTGDVEPLLIVEA